MKINNKTPEEKEYRDILLKCYSHSCIFLGVSVLVINLFMLSFGNALGGFLLIASLVSHRLCRLGADEGIGEDFIKSNKIFDMCDKLDLVVLVLTAVNIILFVV